MTEKPPVPSDELTQRARLAAIDIITSTGALTTFAVMQGWLAGYRAREAERPASARELAEKYGFREHKIDAADERIVDELMVRRASTLGEHPMPRRTPELTEKVARRLAIFNRMAWQFMNDTERDLYREGATEVLDEVFGKKEE